MRSGLRSHLHSPSLKVLGRPTMRPGRAHKLGFPNLRLHDLRGTHETLLLDACLHTSWRLAAGMIPRSC
jgi:hypothetical protein